VDLFHVQDLDARAVGDDQAAAYSTSRHPGCRRSTRAVSGLVIQAVELLHVEDLPARR
jgi:hypothetical protein